MRPTIDEVLEGVEVSFVRDLLPEIQTEWGRRIAAAVLDAVGHVRLRLAHERRLVEEELADLRGVCAVLGLSPEGAASAAAIGEIATDGVEAETMHLRAAVEAALRSGDVVAGSEDDGRWQAVLAYLGRQLDRENQLLPKA